MSAAPDLRVMGMPIRVVALLTLMLQNAAFALLLHQARQVGTTFSSLIISVTHSGSPVLGRCVRSDRKAMTDDAGPCF